MTIFKDASTTVFKDVPIIDFRGTPDCGKHLVEEIVEDKLKHTIGSQLEDGSISESTLEVLNDLCPEVLVSDVRMVEESEEDKLCREVMEEPNDTIHYSARVTIPYPIRYIVMTLEVGKISDFDPSGEDK
jgi:hypothetical protein